LICAGPVEIVRPNFEVATVCEACLPEPMTMGLAARFSWPIRGWSVRFPGLFICAGPVLMVKHHLCLGVVCIPEPMTIGLARALAASTARIVV
jgi:hypothetical protein